MARKPHIHLTGGLYHVILRGNGGQPIILTDEDRCRFYLLLQERTAATTDTFRGSAMVDWLAYESELHHPHRGRPIWQPG